MKPSLRLCALFIFAALLLSGCAAKPIEPGPALTQPPFASPAAPTPAKTPVPTLAPTHAPTPEPTPVIEGLVELAEGFFYHPLTDEIKARITGLSYPKNDEKAEISYDDLCYLSILHVDFEGRVKTGELIVNRAVAGEVLDIFYELYNARYPLTSVLLVDEFGEAADDNASMAANNTSSFNYRVVEGTKKLSLHSYGLAIDINPLLNPYVKSDGSISPPDGAVYADRSEDFLGRIDKNDLCYKLFVERGWEWGGAWKNSKDYQHFSKAIEP